MKNLIFEFLQHDDEQIAALLSLATGCPTSEKIKQVAAMYVSAKRYLLGIIKEGELIALAGVEVKEKCLIIHHLAVKESCQYQGLGKALIKELVKRFSPSIIMAETDQDAVEFYRKCGFVCRPVQGKYPGRQLCERQLISARP